MELPDPIIIKQGLSVIALSKHVKNGAPLEIPCRLVCVCSHDDCCMSALSFLNGFYIELVFIVEALMA